MRLRQVSRGLGVAITVLLVLLIIPALTLFWTALVSYTGYVATWVDRAEHARLDRVQVSMLARESVLHVVFLGLTPLGWFRVPLVHTPAPPGRKPHHRPVLLVCDYGLNPLSFVFLTTFLRHRGFEWVWPVPTRSGKLAIRAEKLRQCIAHACQTTGSAQVDVIGHGAGGLVAAWATKDPACAAQVRQLITLGTPFKGTRMAAFAWEPLGRELLYNHPTLSALTPLQVPTLCVWSPDDPRVVPASSAAVAHSEAVRMDGLGHFDFLASGKVFHTLYRALQRPIEPSDHASP